MDSNQADGVIRGPLPTTTKNKFVGGQNMDCTPDRGDRKMFIPVPTQIKEAADQLGLDFSETLTRESIHAAWRRQICMPEHHPDLGGNAEKAILLNLAKDQMTKWLDNYEPKLAKFLQPNVNQRS